MSIELVKGGDPAVDLALGAEARKAKCSMELNAIMEKYQCVPVIIEVRRAGATVQLGIEWEPKENLGQPGPGRKLIL